jgi:lysophospholipase II
VFPDAGQRWCTTFEDSRSAWFDTFSLDDLTARQNLQVAGLIDGTYHVQDIVRTEISLLGGVSRSVILGGFSQGAATALWSLFRGAIASEGPLGAFIGMSAWIPFMNEVKEAVFGETEIPADSVGNLRAASSTLFEAEPIATLEAMRASFQMPVLLGHGTNVRDPVSFCR